MLPLPCGGSVPLNTSVSPAFVSLIILYTFVAIKAIKFLKDIKLKNNIRGNFVFGCLCHTCYVVKEVFNKIFPQENIGVWGTLPVNCERHACLGVFWEFVIFTISKYPNGKPLAMFTNFEIRPLKCSFSCGFIKILSQRYFCTLSSFIFYHLNAFFNAQFWANQAIIILRGILSHKKQYLNIFLPYILKQKRPFWDI